jgi:hypothetical protein
MRVVLRVLWVFIDPLQSEPFGSYMFLTGHATVSMCHMGRMGHSIGRAMFPMGPTGRALGTMCLTLGFWVYIVYI